MEMLGMLALVVIAFFLVKVINASGGKPKQSVRQDVQTVPKKEQTISAVQSRPLDEFAASPHYQQVKGLLNTYDPYDKQPKYKIELLMQSLDSGINIHDIDTQFYIGQSIEKSLPYFCETEYEFNKFFNGSQPVLFGSIHGILDLINAYTIGYTLCGYNRAHSGKKNTGRSGCVS